VAALVTLAGGLVMAAAPTGPADRGRLSRFRRPARLRLHRLQPARCRNWPASPQVALVTAARAPFTAMPRCAPCRKPIDPGSFAVFRQAAWPGWSSCSPADAGL